MHLGEAKPPKQRWFGEEKCYENEIISTAFTGWQFHVRRHSSILWNRIGRVRTWLLCPATSASVSDLCCSGRSGSGLCLGAWLLLSRRASILMACWILGATTLCGSLLGRPEVLRTSILSRLLAPVTNLLELDQDHAVGGNFSGIHTAYLPAIRMCPKIMDFALAVNTEVGKSGRYFGNSRTAVK